MGRENSPGTEPSKRRKWSPKRLSPFLQAAIMLTLLISLTQNPCRPALSAQPEANTQGEEALDQLGEEPIASTAILTRTFFYGSQTVDEGVLVPLAPDTFLYASPAWPTGWFDCFPSVRKIFFYYSPEMYDQLGDKLKHLHEQNRSAYTVLDPTLRADQTFLDLFYDSRARQDLISNLSRTIRNLTEIGVDGFVLGDEWPRGACEGPVTMEAVTRYNETYHTETSRWMSKDGGSREEKALLGRWFYDRSITAWNLIATAISTDSPEIVLGTNIDLFLKPEYEAPDLAFWTSGQLAGKLEMAPYDFILAHYFTGMPEDSEAGEVDQASLGILNSSVDTMLSITQPNGKTLYVLLAAHYNEPRVITPRQMVAEWNVVAKKNLGAIGWFAFDGWEVNAGNNSWRETSYLGDQPKYVAPLQSVSIPYRYDRFLALRTLSNLRGEAILEKELAEVSAGLQPTGCTQELYHTLPIEEFLVARFSPLDTYLMILSQTAIQIRSPASPWSILEEIHCHGGLFLSADWSRDGRIAYTTTDARLGILYLSSPDSNETDGHPEPGLPGGIVKLEEAQLNGFRFRGSVSWSPQGGLLACEVEEGVVLLDTSKPLGEEMCLGLITVQNPDWHLAGWSYDGRCLAVEESTGIELWEINVTQGAQTRQAAQAGQTTEPDGPRKMARVQVVDLCWGSVSWAHHGLCLAWATTAENRTKLSVLDLESNLTVSYNLGRLAGNVTASDWDPAGRWIFLGTEGGDVYNVAVLGEKLGIVRRRYERIQTTDDFVSVWLSRWLPPGAGKWGGQTSNLSPPRRLEQEVAVRSVRYAGSASGLSVLVCRACTVSVETCQNLSCALADDGSVICHLWGFEREIPAFNVNLTARVRAIDWSTAEPLLAASFEGPDNTIRVWEVKPDGTAQLVRSLWDADTPGALEFSPGGDALVFCNGAGLVRRWYLRDNEVVGLLGVSSPVYLIRHSPDGNLLLVVHGPGHRAEVLGLGGGSYATEVGSEIYSAAWSPKGLCLATGSIDGIALWRVDGSELLPVYKGATELPARWVEFSWDGSFLAAIHPVGNDTAELSLYQAEGCVLRLVQTVRLALRLSGDGLGDPLAWHPGWNGVAVGFGLSEYKDPWREEWLKVVVGNVYFEPRWYWFEGLRPGVGIWEAGSCGLVECVCFPTLTSDVMDLEWSADGSCLATASDDGWILLWSVHMLVGEAGCDTWLILLLAAILVLTVTRAQRARYRRRCPTCGGLQPCQVHP